MQPPDAKKIIDDIHAGSQLVYEEVKAKYGEERADLISELANLVGIFRMHLGLHPVDQHFVGHFSHCMHHLVESAASLSGIPQPEFQAWLMKCCDARVRKIDVSVQELVGGKVGHSNPIPES